MTLRNAARVLCALAGLSLAAPAFSENEREREKETETEIERSSEKTATTSAGQLADNPGSFYGRRVEVEAEVERVANPHVFTLDEDKIGAGPDVLVIVPDPARGRVVDGSTVTVTGTVRRFDWTELRRDYDWFDLTPDLRVELESRPVIVAESIRGADGAMLMTDEPEGAVAAQAGAIAQRPQDYMGREVTVLADVEKVLTPKAFTLDEDRLLAGPDVLVLLPERAAQSITDEMKVKVTGEVKRFVHAEIEREYAWFDVDPALVVDLDARPVIIASEVRSADGKELFAAKATEESPAAPAGRSSEAR